MSEDRDGWFRSWTIAKPWRVRLVCFFVRAFIWFALICDFLLFLPSALADHWRACREEAEDVLQDAATFEKQNT